MGDKTRFYAVSNKTDPKDVRLIDAATQSQAIKHVVKGTFSAKPVTTRELAELLAAGTKIEKAGPDVDEGQLDIEDVAGKGG